MPVTRTRRLVPLAALSLALVAPLARAQPGRYFVHDDGPALPLATPDASLIDPAAFESLRADVEATGGHTVIATVDGRLAAAWSSDGDFPLIETMSATKSIVALALAALVTDGALPSFDTTLADALPAFSERYPDDVRARSVTVRDLMAHTSGLGRGANSGPIYEADDSLAFAIESGFDRPRGVTFLYNNNAVNLLMGVIAHAAGEPADEYIARRLFAPLGITRWAWYRDPSGHPHGMAGCKLSAANAAKLGQLVLNRGVWHAERLVRPDLMDEMTAAAQPMLPRSGLLWWRYELGPEVRTISGDALDALVLAARQGDLDASPEEAQRWADAVRPLAGKTGSREELERAVREAFESNAADADGLFAADQSMGTFLLRREPRPVGAYYADGYLGQFIVAVPDRGLVVVRQQTLREHPEPLDFERFMQGVLSLVPGPEADPNEHEPARKPAGT